MASTAPIPPSAAPLSAFKALSTSTFLYRPSTTAAPGPGAPRLILFLSWMDARDVHIAKYTTRHQALWPASPILLIKSTLPHVRQPKLALAELQPAVPALLAALNLDARTVPTSASPSGSDDSLQPPLLVHLLSNGGGITLGHLCDALRAQTKMPTAQLPAHVTIFDSVPGRFSYWRGIAALAPQGGHHPLVRWLVMVPFAHMLMAWLWVVHRVVRRNDPLRAAGARHNERAGGNGREVRRVYVYSEADKLVDWRAVEEHAAEAKREGFSVRLEKYGDSPHVAHARTDEGRYWRAVREVWGGEEGV